MNRPHSAQSSQSIHAGPGPGFARSAVPPTRVLLDALRQPVFATRAYPVLAPSGGAPADSAPGASGASAASGIAGARWRRWLLWLFWGAAVGAAAVLAAALVFRLHLRQAPPAGTLTFLYILLGAGSAALAALLLSLLSTARATLRHPLRALADRIDADAEAENALLLALRRLPPLALRARQRRIELQLCMWEGVSRTVLLLIALGPLALGIVTGMVELPRAGGTLVPLLSLYGAAFVFGAALALFVQLQCSSPLRRLAHVLREAAEIGAQLQRRDPGDDGAGQSARAAQTAA